LERGRGGQGPGHDRLRLRPAAEPGPELRECGPKSTHRGPNVDQKVRMIQSNTALFSGIWRDFAPHQSPPKRVWWWGRRLGDAAPTTKRRRKTAMRWIVVRAP